jgi:hypothetical protein
MLPIQAASVRRNRSDGPLSCAVGAGAMLPTGRPFVYHNFHMCDDCGSPRQPVQCGTTGLFACCSGSSVHLEGGQCKCG